MMTVNTMIAEMTNVAADVKMIFAQVDQFDCLNVGGVTNVVVDGDKVKIVFEELDDNTLTGFDVVEGENWGWLDEDNEKVINFVNENGRSNYICDDEEEWDEDEEVDDECDVQNNVMDLNVQVWKNNVVNYVYNNDKYLTIGEIINKLNSVDGDLNIVFERFGETVNNVNFEVTTNFDSKDFEFDFVSGDEQLCEKAKKYFVCRQFVLC